MSNATYLCWAPDYGETFDDAGKVDALDVQHAAQLFAECEFNQGDPFSYIAVHVKPDHSEDVYLVEVEVIPEPVFYAGTAKQIPLVTLTPKEGP